MCLSFLLYHYWFLLHSPRVFPASVPTCGNTPHPASNTEYVLLTTLLKQRPILEPTCQANKKQLVFYGLYPRNVLLLKKHLLESRFMILKNTQKLIVSSLFLCIGLVLLFLTMQIRGIGNMFLPMHLPVLICGLICGWKYGFAIGFITPLLRSFLFSMPIMFPNAVCMAFELATYGFVSGLLYQTLPSGKWKIYISLIAAMLTGRMIWRLVCVLIYGLSNYVYTWNIFISAALFNAVPGIILQLVLIPILMLTLEKFELIKNDTL